MALHVGQFVTVEGYSNLGRVYRFDLSTRRATGVVVALFDHADLHSDGSPKYGGYGTRHVVVQPDRIIEQVAA